MKFRSAVFGSSGNPPTNAHRDIMGALARSPLCEEVLDVPCGARPDKPDFVLGVHRLAMANILSEDPSFPQGRVKLSTIDIFSERYMPTIELMRMLDALRPHVQHQIVVGSDLLVARASQGGLCDVETWEEGDKLMTQWPFLITRRPGVPIGALRLPTQFDFVDAEFPDISSTEVRARIARGESIADLVPYDIAAYIEKNNLYRKVRA